jgi:hypothetical protein
VAGLIGGFAPARGHGDKEALARAACLDKNDATRGISGQPVGEHATGRPAAYDYEVGLHLILLSAWTLASDVTNHALDSAHFGRHHSRQKGDAMEDESHNGNFGKLHAVHTAALARHLIACRRACDGDLDLFLVLTIIGERTFTPRNVPDEMSFADFRDGTVKSVTPAAINLQSISDYSGIPRETVRRKIEALIAKGWVERNDRRHVTATDAANFSLLQLTESAVRYLRETQAAMQAYGPV